MLPESTGEGGRPHVKGRSSRQREEEEEGHLEAQPVHQTSGHGAEAQLPHHFQRRQETVVGGLKMTVGKRDEGEQKKKKRRRKSEKF